MRCCDCAVAISGALLLVLLKGIGCTCLRIALPFCLWLSQLGWMPVLGVMIQGTGNREARAIADISGVTGDPTVETSPRYPAIGGIWFARCPRVRHVCQDLVPGLRRSSTPSLRRDELGDRRAGGISRQASDGLSPKRTIGETHKHHQPARQTVPPMHSGTWVSAKKHANQISSGGCRISFVSRSFRHGLLLFHASSPLPGTWRRPTGARVISQAAAALASAFPSAHPQANDAMHRGSGQVTRRQLEINR